MAVLFMFSNQIVVLLWSVCYVYFLKGICYRSPIATARGTTIRQIPIRYCQGYNHKTGPHQQNTILNKRGAFYCPDCRNVNIRTVFIHHVTHLEFLNGITINAHLQHNLPSSSFLQTSCIPLCFPEP